MTSCYKGKCPFAVKESAVPVAGLREEVAATTEEAGWRGDNPEGTSESVKDCGSWRLLFPEEE